MPNARLAATRGSEVEVPTIAAAAYARHPPNGHKSIRCIDAFAELVGRKVSVYLGDRAKADRVFRVSDADGNVDEEE